MFRERYSSRRLENGQQSQWAYIEELPLSARHILDFDPTDSTDVQRAQRSAGLARAEGYNIIALRISDTQHALYTYIQEYRVPALEL